jgi:hypothetical protein
VMEVCCLGVMSQASICPCLDVALLQSPNFITYLLGNCVSSCTVVVVLMYSLSVLINSTCNFCFRLALFKGWWSLVVSLFITNFVYFYVFHGLRLYMVSVSDVDQAAFNDLFFGLLAG